MSKQQELADAAVAGRIAAKLKAVGPLPADVTAVAVNGHVQIVPSDASMIERLERLLKVEPDHPKAAGWRAKLAALKG